MHYIIKEKAQNLPLLPGSVKHFQCAFFNASGGPNQTVGWCYSGIKTEIINDTHIRCSASHLTTFVILVSLIPAAEENPVSLNTCCTYYLLILCCTRRYRHVFYMVVTPWSILLLTACAGLHYIHWLQRFLSLYNIIQHVLYV